MWRTLLPVLLCFLSGSASAQQYTFRKYSVGDGLAQSQVYTICEDDRGYLWMGTRGGGLNRFDGSEFANYRVDDGLSNDFIYSVDTDRNGNVWIGTDEGACTFDGLKFTPVPLPGRPHKVRAILCGSDGRTWIGTEDTGLFVLDGTDITLHREGPVLPSKRVNCIYEDTMAASGWERRSV